MAIGESANERPYLKLLYNSVIMVASVTAILYLFGYLYYTAFCNRLSIPCAFTDLPISQCITGAMIPLAKLSAVFVVFFIISLTIIISKYKENWIKGIFILIFILITVLTAVTRQEIFLIACLLAALILAMAIASYPITKSMVRGAVSGFISIIFLIFVYTPYDVSPAVVSPVYMVMMKMVVGVFIVTIVFYYIKSKKNAIKSHIDRSKPDNITKIYVLITLILITCFTSMFLGTIDAENMIDGTSSNALQVDISLKDKDNTPFENKTLILVMLRDDTYYIIERDGNRPKKPKVYIIPSDQIKMMVVYESGKGIFTNLYNR